MGRVARWLAFLVLLAATICGPAQAATVFLEDLTWTELRDEIVAGKTTVIVRSAAPSRTVRTCRLASTT
jgi:hypothetical protein